MDYRSCTLRVSSLSDALTINFCLLFLAGCSVTLHLIYTNSQLLPKVVVWPLPTTPRASATCARSRNQGAAARAGSAKQLQRKLTLVFHPASEKFFVLGLCNHQIFYKWSRAWVWRRLCGRGSGVTFSVAVISITAKVKEHPMIKDFFQDNYCNAWLFSPISLPPSDRDSGQGRTDSFEGICLWKFPGKS